MNYIKTLFAITFLICNYANAAWSIWKPEQAINVYGNITIPANQPKGSFYFTSPLSIGSGIVLAEDCSYMSNRGSKWFYLALPSRVDVGDSGAYLTFELSGGGYQFNSTRNGWNIYHKKNPYVYEAQTCFGRGTSYPKVEYNWGTVKVDVVLNDGYKLQPGEHRISNAFRYIFREDRGASTTQANEAAIQHLLTGDTIHSIAIGVNYTPKCTINTAGINLDFGTFTPDEAKGKISSKAAINVTCERAATIELRLKGSQPIRGKSENYTDCENNNYCAIVFNDGSSFNIKVSNTSVINESISAIFEPNQSGQLTAGEFQGSGILTLFF
ncbi:hypothetical protein FE066_20820, partial [Salmonella enterica]|nr:hypothetical protein [Salmonella enterica]